MLKLGILCCVIATVFAKNTYVVVLPKVVRPGFKLNVGVNILKATSGVSVNASLVDSASKAVLASAQDTVVQGSPHTLTIQVPRHLNHSSYEVEVSGGGGLVFKNSTKVEFNTKGTAVFIQTDKAMYKPGQTVNFRTFSVYPDLRPYQGQFTVEIYDPNSNKIKQWLNVRDMSSVVTERFVLSDQPVLGDWKIKVSTDYHGEEKVFTVAEYVLPKFKVSVNLPSFGLTRDKLLSGSVEAKYTYGKPVSGTAHIRIKDKIWHRGYMVTGPQPMVETDIKIVEGKGEFSFDRSRAMHALGQPDRARTVIVEANVTDSLTDITLNGSSEMQYYVQGVKLTWLKSNPKNFKPGLEYTAYLKVSQPDESLLQGIKKDVSLVTSVIYSIPEESSTTPYPYYSHYPRTGTYNLQVQNFTVPDNGLVAAQITIPENATELSVKAEYPGGQTITAYLSIQKMYSPSSSYLQTFLRSQQLAAGQTAEFELKSTEPLNTVVYQVLSRGVIVTTGTVDGRGGKSIPFSIPMTSEMAPNARILVYFVRADGEIVTDSISFNVDGLFANKVSVKFNKNKGEPGQKVDVIVSADADSVVNILAVDQSVKLLKSGNDITESQVRDAVGLFDSVSGPVIEPFFGGGMAFREKRMVWWPYPYFYGGDDAGDIFRNSGVLVMTDALVFHHEELICNIGTDYRSLQKMTTNGISKPPVTSPSTPSNVDPIYEKFFEKGTVGGSLSPSLAPVGRIRQDFPETWLWTSRTVGVSVYGVKGSWDGWFETRTPCYCDHSPQELSRNMAMVKYKCWSDLRYGTSEPHQEAMVQLSPDRNNRTK